jgi:D-galactarolactone cycloisomerase
MPAPHLSRIELQHLEVVFADLFNGAANVPSHLRFPGASFKAAPRRGQSSLLVRLVDSEGRAGLGEAWGLPIAEPAVAIIEKMFTPALLGRDADDIDAIWTDLVCMIERLGYTRGVHWEALSGVDIALWDLRGHRSGRSLSALLNPSPLKSVGVYAGSIVFQETEAAARVAARALLEKGFTAIKIKVGRGVETDLRHVAAIRAEVGPKIALLLDANCGYNVDDAIAFGRRVDRHDIYWYEEPIVPENVGGLAQVKKNVGLRIATGENEFNAHSIREILRAGAADVIMPNVIRCGGITGFLKIAAVTEEFGARISLHGVGSGVMLYASLQAIAAAKNPELFEFNQFPNPLRDHLIDGDAEFTGAAFRVPTGPGWGGTIRGDVQAKYAARNGAAAVKAVA